MVIRKHFLHTAYLIELRCSMNSVKYTYTDKIIVSVLRPVKILIEENRPTTVSSANQIRL